MSYEVEITDEVYDRIGEKWPEAIWDELKSHLAQLENFDVDKAQKATCPPYVPVGYVHHFKIEFETKTHRCTAFYVVDGLVVKVHGITAIPRFHLKSN